MSKRFTSTDKWSDPWFRKLPPEYKLFWLYICDQCDNAGVWNVDFELADFQTGMRISCARALEIFEQRIQVLGDRHWLIKNFIRFQYGELSADSRPHQAVALLLKRHGVSIPYGKGIHTLYLRNKRKLKTLTPTSKTLEITERVLGRTNRFLKPTPEEVRNYAGGLGFDLDGHRFVDFYESKGWMIGTSPMRSWKAAVRTWKNNPRNGEQAENGPPQWMKQ